jgi:hypothetical protein
MWCSSEAAAGLVGEGEAQLGLGRAPESGSMAFSRPGARFSFRPITRGRAGAPAQAGQR